MAGQHNVPAQKVLLEENGCTSKILVITAIPVQSSYFCAKNQN